MTTLRFDPSKPHGTVTPPYNGAVWHQVASDGKDYYFNGAGEPVNIETGEVLSVAVAKAAPKVVKTREMTVDKDGEKIVREVETEVKEEKDPRYELLQWLRGVEGAETNWMTVRSYGKSVFGRIASSKDELISMAIDNELIPAEQVKA